MPRGSINHLFTIFWLLDSMYLFIFQNILNSIYKFWCIHINMFCSSSSNMVYCICIALVCLINKIWKVMYLVFWILTVQYITYFLDIVWLVLWHIGRCDLLYISCCCFLHFMTHFFDQCVNRYFIMTGMNQGINITACSHGRAL